jgi:hypothetical protein
MCSLVGAVPASGTIHDDHLGDPDLLCCAGSHMIAIIKQVCVYTPISTREQQRPPFELCNMVTSLFE